MNRGETFVLLMFLGLIVAFEHDTLKTLREIKATEKRIEVFARAIFLQNASEINGVGFDPKDACMSEGKSR